MTKSPFYILLLAIAVLVVATFLEPNAGAEVVKKMIYGTWWFRILWGMVTLAGLWLIWKRKLWKRPLVCLLHLSFVIILAGGLTTALTSTNGSLYLREGEQSNMFLTSENRVAHMDFMLRLDKFDIDYYAGTEDPKDYISHVTIIDKDGTTTNAAISMNKILRHRQLRFYQASYAPDKHGSIFSVSHDPYGIAITYAGYALLFLTGLLLLIPKRIKASKSLIVVAFALLVSGFYTYNWITADRLLPVLRSPLLGIHVSIIIIAYSLFLAMAVGGIYALWYDHLHPHPSESQQQRIEQVHSGLRSLLLYAEVCLSVGIFLGAIWANISWGNYWSWDPKEVWALITLLIYCLPFHRVSLPWFRSDRHFIIYIIGAFTCVLITYFGVNYLLGGMHSYAN